MSPVRHEDDFRRKPIKDWDTYIEDAITESQARGEFDNLPDAGKPIRIQTNPLAPELDFAFSRLRNAGYKPTWMELDEEIKAAQERLRAFLDDSASYLCHHADQIHLTTSADSGLIVRQPPFWKRLHFGVSPTTNSSAGPKSMDDLHEIIARMRNQYLERSAQLDKRIGKFNSSLARDLWHLERMRLTPERAARTFDAAIDSGDPASTYETRPIH